MPDRILNFSLLLWLAALLALSGCAASDPKGPTIFAASSLQKPLEDLATDWAEQGHAPPVFSFASSATLARQIDNGSTSDLFISADRQWIDYLVTAGRLDSRSVRTIAGNGLVLARLAKVDPRDGPRDGPRGGITGAQNTAPSNREFVTTGKIAIGDPETVPLGHFTRQWLESEGLWRAAQPNLVPVQSSSAAVRLVLRGEVSGGILYVSDAASIADLAAIRAVPANTHDPIAYQAVLLPSSAHPDAAAFLQFLVSDRAQQTFAKYGFTAP